MKKMLWITAAMASALVFGCTDYATLVPPGTTADSKLQVCHVTGKKGKYNLITVKASAAQAHADHGDFLAPVGAKKDADCVPPVVIPPVIVPPTGIPTTVPPTTIPTDTVPPVVVPPVVIPTVDSVVGSVKELPPEIQDVPCIVNPWQPQCQL